MAVLSNEDEETIGVGGERVAMEVEIDEFGA